MAREPHRWSPVCPPPTSLVRPRRLAPHDPLGPTRGQARGTAWRQTSWGYYVPASVDTAVPEQRILEQSVRCPAGGAVTGWAACRLHGARFFDGLGQDGRTELPVPIVTGGPFVRGDARVDVRRDAIDTAEIENRFGVSCASVLRATFDAMRRHELREAVVDLDMMAAAELVSIRRLRRYAVAHPGRRGSRVVAAALDLASEHSRSPNETRTRLIWLLDAGLPAPLVNRSVFDRQGRLLGIADLLDLDAGLVGEFDGADHRTAGRHSSDVAREDRFRRAGLEVFRVTGPDLREPGRVVERMLSARRRAPWDDVGTRRWTVEPPTWWEAPPTLDDLLDERDALRDFHRESERLGLV